MPDFVVNAGADVCGGRDGEDSGGRAPSPRAAEEPWGVDGHHETGQ